MSPKRKLGDRRDGKYLKRLDSYYRFTPYIMRTRTGSTVYFSDEFDLERAEEFLQDKRRNGYKGMGLLHLFIASYIRTLSQRPALNRFISGRRIYARNTIEFVMSIKKEMLSDAGETSIKVVFEPTDTIYDVYNKINEEIRKVKEEEEDTSTDEVADFLLKCPRWLIRGIVRFAEFLDYLGWLPKDLMQASPFHGSIVMSDLGSIGIRSVYHHLYEFGNIPAFLTFGAKRHRFELQEDGTVVKKRYVEYTFTADERICDGFYFAHSFKYMKKYFTHPEILETPPEKVVKDEIIR